MQTASDLLKKGVEYAQNENYKEAENCFRQSLELDPDNPITIRNLGNACAADGRITEGLVYLTQYLDMRPEDLETMGHVLYLKYNYCVWNGLERMQERLKKGLHEHTLQSEPKLLFLGMSFEERYHYMTKLAAENKKLTELRSEKPFALPFYHHDKLKVGFFTTDVGPSPCGFVIASLWDHLSHQAFEWHCFSCRKLSNKLEDAALITRHKAAFDVFHDVSDIQDYRTMAETIAKAEIDILIDVNMLINSMYPSLYYKPAPVIVNYLGYPSTTGLTWYDYMIADAYVVPTQEEHWFTEKIIRMPNCYHCVDTSPESHPGVAPRSILGLPEKSVIFACLNSPFKITPRYWDMWMRILKAVPNSVLWLRSFNFETDDKLKEEAKKRGVDPARIIVLPKMPTHADFLYCFKNADLFLDTEMYNAHSTALESLFCGVPLITCPGESYASRVSASMLNAFGLPELICPSEEAYEQKAIELGNNPEKLNCLKAKTVALMTPNNPLFDMKQYTLDFENLLRQMASEKGL